MQIAVGVDPAETAGGPNDDRGLFSTEIVQARLVVGPESRVLSVVRVQAQGGGIDGRHPLHEGIEVVATELKNAIVGIRLRPNKVSRLGVRIFRGKLFAKEFLHRVDRHTNPFRKQSVIDQRRQKPGGNQNTEPGPQRARSDPLPARGAFT